MAQVAPLPALSFTYLPGGGDDSPTASFPQHRMEPSGRRPQV
jgi:hypothetical protein